MSGNASRTGSSQSTRSCQSDNSDKPTTRSPANVQVNEPPKKRTVASQRYDSYRTAFYGSAAEKEAYRQQIRFQLKEQVKEKDELHRKQLIDRVAESDNAVAEDHKFKMEDSNTRQKKANYLKQFSNENKKIMEEKERSSRKMREADMELERKLLDVNPINWNMTLH